jgi:membrane-bound serine protease (ClpP class)
MDSIANAIWTLLTNPTVAYLLLVLGMWAVVLAASIPGTGLPEAGAVICLALAAVGLTQLPVNLAGLALIGLALALFVLEFRLAAHGAFLIGGAVALAVGSLLLFRVEGRTEAALSWGTVLAVTLASTAGFGFFIWRGLAAQRLPPLQDPSRVVGSRGVAQTDVNGAQAGTVYVAGEAWSAHADDKIPAGSPIVVLARDGLHLKVAPANKPKTAG